MRIQWLASILILTLNACHLPRNMAGPSTAPAGDSPATRSGTALEAGNPGQVAAFPARGEQATAANVMNYSTISLMDAAGRTMWSTLTNSSGAFTLSYTLPAGSASATIPYYLEAAHGLNSTLPGNEVGRFRTVLQWNGAGWLSCTNAAVGGTISINQFTTALAIEKGLDNNIPLANLINKVNSTPALNAAPTVTGHPDPEINNLAADVMASLTANLDPVAKVPAVTPSIASILPSSGAVGTMLRLTGAGFAPTIAGNTVTFNGTGTPGTVLLASPTQLVVTVPAGAQTGPITVTTGRGSVVSVPQFTITNGSTGGMTIDVVSPMSGRVGTTVTLTGNFGSGPATPSVYFSAPAAYPAAQADVSAWNPTSITCTVPYGSAAGPLTVQVGAAALTSPDWFDLWTGEIGQFDSMYQTGIGYAYTTPWSMSGYANATASIGGVLYYYQCGGTSADYNVTQVFPVSTITNNLQRPRMCTRLVTGRYYAKAVVLGSAANASGAWSGYWLYVIGGRNSAGTYLTDLERAQILTDGSLSTWTSLPNVLLTARAEATAVVRTSTNHIYVIGGYNGAYLNTWELLTVTLSTGAVVRSNTGTIYNGAVATTASDCSAVLSGTGILLHLGYSGGWVKITLTLPIDPNDYTLGAGVAQTATTYSHGYGSMAVIGSDVYLFGGQGGAYVEHATFNFADATISGAWINAGMAANFTTCNYSGPPLVTPNRVVWLTGGGGIGAQIECAYVETDQSIRYWQYWGQTRHNWYGAAWYTVGRNIWRLDGYDGTLSTYNNSTEYYTLDDDGTLGPAINGPDATYQRSVATTQRTTNLATNYVYMIGGYGNGIYHYTVERAAINDAAGTIGPLSLVSNAVLYAGVQYASSQIIGKYLYVFGGYNGTWTSGMKIVQRAQINSDGTLGDFELFPQQLPWNYYGGHPVRIKNFMYLISGYWNGSNYPYVMRATIYPDGDIGTFNWVQSIQTAGYYGAFMPVGNWMYLIGAAGFTNYGQRAYIKNDGTFDTWQAWRPGGQNPLVGTTAYNFTTGLPTYKDHIFVMSGQGAGMYVQHATIR